MIDIVAGTAVLLGSALTVLAAVGLLRFPDALTRLHASSKAASIGVIATTLAAAAEADTPDAIALLVLVVGLLFLSAPLGASLLARAAARDADTPLVSMARNDLGPVEPETAYRRPAPGEVGAAPAFLAGWLVLVWIALFASVTPGVVIGALTVGVVVTLALPGLRPRRPSGRLRLPALIRLAAHFVWSVAAANIDVAGAVISRREPRPAIVEIQLHVESPTETALLMNMITFTPGTIALELHEQTLSVHVLDLDLDLDDAESFVAELTTLERLVIDAFGSRRERTVIARGEGGLGS
jgi:multicomponent Na+:H+ antiporter subunit G